MHATTPKGIVGSFECPVLRRNLKELHGRPRTYVCECQRKVKKLVLTATVVRNSVLIISHITFRDCRVHIFSDNLSRNSCILAHYLCALFEPIFLYVFLEKDFNGKKKKIVVTCLDVITIPFFPRNIHWSSLFAQKARVNTERVPPGHPIIFLKSNKFNMAAVLVKRSIPVACLAGEIIGRVL